MAAIAVAGFLVAAGVMADQHRWLWPTLLLWAGAIAANHWLGDAYDTTGEAVYSSGLIVSLVMVPVSIGWLLMRLVRRARERGPEWDRLPEA